MGKIIKLLNHNAVIVHETQTNQVLLLLCKGIGFGKKINEQVEIPSDCDMYHLNPMTSKGTTVDLLRKLDPIYIEISSQLLSLAKGHYQNIDENIVLALGDHIAFAIERMRKGMEITNPFSNEIKFLYPQEYEIAKHAKMIIKEKLDIEINDDEIGYITLHIHSAIDHSVSEGMLVAVIVNESIHEITKKYGIDFDVNSISYGRLMTHMKYLLARLKKQEVLTLDMNEYTQKRIPQSYEMAKKIILKIEDALNILIPNNEIGYLAIHIERICQPKS